MTTIDIKNKTLENFYMPIMCFILGLSICSSTAIMSATYIAIAFFVLFKRDFLLSLKHAFKNKFIITSVMFYGVFVVGTLWSVAPAHDAFKMLTRIHGFLLVPLLFVAFQFGSSAKMLLRGFILGAIITASLSVISFLSNHHILYGTKDTTWVIFHGHILHNAFMAIASGFILCEILNPKNNKMRIFYIICYLILLIDVLFIVIGRTGQIMFGCINIFLLLYYFRTKGILIAFVILSILAPLLYLSPAIKIGLNNYQSDVENYNQGNMETSFGLRLVFHRVSAAIIQEKPFFGYGTGSFNAVYKNYINKHNIKILTTNPHRDILWIGVETGIIGIAMFTFMIICIMIDMFYTSYPVRGIGFGIIFSYLIASIHNSFFIDNITGMAFIVLISGLIAFNKTNPIHSSSLKPGRR